MERRDMRILPDQCQYKLLLIFGQRQGTMRYASFRNSSMFLVLERCDLMSCALCFFRASLTIGVMSVIICTLHAV